MDRITKKYSDGKPFIPNEKIQLIGMEGVAKSLAEFEDLEEKELLLKMPCKVGDTVFCIVNKKIVEDIVDRIEINSMCKKISTKEHSWLCNFDRVFLTRDAAEQELQNKIRH